MSASAPSVLVAIGTRKGLWLARSDDRRTWSLDGPHLLMTEVPSVAIDTRGGTPHLMVGARSEHWGPTVQHSDDLGRTWSEHEGDRFPAALRAGHTVGVQFHPEKSSAPGVAFVAAWVRSLGGGR